MTENAEFYFDQSRFPKDINDRDPVRGSSSVFASKRDYHLAGNGMVALHCAPIPVPLSDFSLFSRLVSDGSIK